MDRLTIIKVGGKVVEDPLQLNALLDQFKRISGFKMIVHGGGTLATDLSAKLGIETKMLEGRRITDSDTLDIVTMVYAGLINKKIVAGLQARAMNGIGLSGVDLDLIRSHKRAVKDVDYGFVGDIEEINARELRMLIEENATPVIAPLTHDGNGLILNTNADTVASELAIELSNFYNVFLFYCFEKRGVLMDPGNAESVVGLLDEEQYLQMKNNGIISAGMLPKLETAFRAKRHGVKEILITNAINIANGRGTRLI